MILMYFLLTFFCGFWVFCSNHKHLLITLLSLEFVVLILYLLLCYYMNLFNYELFFVLVFLSFSVCEGVLGLSILVSMVRGFGNDYFQSYIVVQC